MYGFGIRGVLVRVPGMAAAIRILRRVVVIVIIVIVMLIGVSGMLWIEEILHHLT